MNPSYSQQYYQKNKQKIKTYNRKYFVLYYEEILKNKKCGIKKPDAPLNGIIIQRNQRITF
jgi:hypothetical protein